MTAPLTPRMREVVDLMRGGWSLYSTGGIDNRYRLQKNEPGRGGESRSVHGSTFFALWTRGLVRAAGRHNLGTLYTLRLDLAVDEEAE